MKTGKMPRGEQSSAKYSDDGDANNWRIRRNGLIRRATTRGEIFVGPTGEASTLATRDEVLRHDTTSPPSIASTFSVALGPKLIIPQAHYERQGTMAENSTVGSSVRLHPTVLFLLLLFPFLFPTQFP